MSSSGSDSRVGTMFGPYELRALIGRGGMGEVYKAYDTVKDRVVALKLLRNDLAADAEFQERFRRESRVAARLQEPHVIPVHDFGEIDGVLYIDMRLVEGPNVKTLINRNGPLEPARSVSLLQQVAAALDAAHRDGLVHRDIKAENVLLTPDDFAYLVDFGIAESVTDPRGTNSSSALGSCAYAAPERFRQSNVGPSSDIYSLACLLYECLTAQLPFPGTDPNEVMRAHLTGPPPRPSSVRRGVNPAFDAVIARGMAKDPTQRFKTGGELARAAKAALTAPRPALAPPAYGAPSGPAHHDFAANRHSSTDDEGKSHVAWIVLAIIAVFALVIVGVAAVRRSGSDANADGGASTSPTTSASAAPPAGAAFGVGDCLSVTQSLIQKESCSDSKGDYQVTEVRGRDETCTSGHRAFSTGQVRYCLTVHLLTGDCYVMTDAGGGSALFQPADDCSGDNVVKVVSQTPGSVDVSQCTGPRTRAFTVNNPKLIVCLSEQ